MNKLIKIELSKDINSDYTSIKIIDVGTTFCVKEIIIDGSIYYVFLSARHCLMENQTTTNDIFDCIVEGYDPNIIDNYSVLVKVSNKVLEIEVPPTKTSYIKLKGYVVRYDDMSYDLAALIIKKPTNREYMGEELNLDVKQYNIDNYSNNDILCIETVSGIKSVDFLKRSNNTLQVSVNAESGWSGSPALKIGTSNVVGILSSSKVDSNHDSKVKHDNICLFPNNIHSWIAEFQDIIQKQTTTLHIKDCDGVIATEHIFATDYTIRVNDGNIILY